MSKLFKAQHTSLAEQSYHIQVTRMTAPTSAPPSDPEWEAARQAAVQEAEAIRAHAAEEAHRILANAEQEAMNLLATERERVESILQSEVELAKEQGFQAGVEAGHRAVEQQFAAQFAEIERLHLSALEERQKYLADSEDLIVELACEVARKIMHRESGVEPDWVLNVVRSALEEIHDAGKIEVRVHPEEYELVHARREGLRKQVPGQTDLLIIPDRGVEAGGCVVQTAFGNIDARIDTQLEEVKKALLEVAAGLKS